MEQTRETTPDELMEDFRGSGLGKIMVFTVVAHLAILLVGTVVPWAWGLVAGPDVAELDEEQRMELAVKEARASMSEIAKEFGLKSPDALSRQMAGGARPAPKPEEEGVDPEAPVDGDPGEPGDAGEEPRSAIEEELEVAEPGPEVPPIPEDDEEDLFR